MTCCINRAALQQQVSAPTTTTFLNDDVLLGFSPYSSGDTVSLGSGLLNFGPGSANIVLRLTFTDQATGNPVEVTYSQWVDDAAGGTPATGSQGGSSNLLEASATAVPPTGGTNEVNGHMQFIVDPNDLITADTTVVVSQEKSVNGGPFVLANQIAISVLA